MRGEHSEPAGLAQRSAGAAPRRLLADLSPVRATVVIVNYNGGDTVLRCLDSVLRSAPADCEVIVVDNGSSDGSPDAIAADLPSVQLIRAGENLGYGGGGNLGARHARGTFLVFLNPDTRVESGWLDALLAPLESDSRVGLTTSKILLAHQPDRINTCGNAIHLTGLTLCRGLGRSKEGFERPEPVDAVSGAAFAIRREVFETLGGFDEDFFLYMEDTDLSWRARLAGWRCLYAPESIVFHDYALRISPRKVFYQERNRYLMLLKNLRWPTLVVLLPALLIAEALTWGFVLWGDRANLGNKAQAYGWIIAHWSSTMRKRKATQRLRRISDRDVLRRAGHQIDFGQVGRGAVVPLARFVFGALFFALKTVALAVVWQ